MLGRPKEKWAMYRNFNEPGSLRSSFQRILCKLLDVHTTCEPRHSKSLAWRTFARRAVWERSLNTEPNSEILNPRCQLSPSLPGCSSCRDLFLTQGLKVTASKPSRLLTALGLVLHRRFIPEDSLHLDIKPPPKK